MAPPTLWHSILDDPPNGESIEFDESDVVAEHRPAALTCENAAPKQSRAIARAQAAVDADKLGAAMSALESVRADSCRQDRAFIVMQVEVRAGRANAARAAAAELQRYEPLDPRQLLELARVACFTGSSADARRALRELMQQRPPQDEDHARKRREFLRSDPQLECIRSTKEFRELAR